jgi:hypothetical protein
MDDHLLASQQIFEREPHSEPPWLSEYYFLKLMTLMMEHFFERLTAIIVVL